MPVPDLIVEACGADDERRWEIVWHLHRHGGREALDAAAPLLSDPDPDRRVLAADILSQLALSQQLSGDTLHEPVLRLLLDAMTREQDPAVLHAIAVAFGHRKDPRGIEPLRRHIAHADPEVRYGVVFGMLGLPDRAALDVLIVLSADPDDKVRDWATFGLAQQSAADFPALRAALLARIDDPDPETRAEAIHGLAVRGDPRAIGPLLEMLDSPVDQDVAYNVHEALYAIAAATGDPRLRAHVAAHRDSWLADVPGEPLPEDLRAALARYRE
ncbi:HEAT repeat domain-containing protein [Dactylosporangium sp. NPDC049525]|uniref:HEAT repeat domain-containing protein n=1 Tax=Dactylosporangium sp. NPDC049525 TaxID=3154730 RepID=UPI00342FCDFB